MIGWVIAGGIFLWAFMGLYALDLLPRNVARHFDNPGKREIWLIRGVAGLSILIGIWAFLLARRDGFWFGYWPELVSIGVTVLGIDELNRRRSDREYKRGIIRQMASRSNDSALEATRIAMDEGWLYDGSLRGANLWRSDLGGEVNLVRASLREVNFKEANLRGALLLGADLRGADLWSANLERAFLIGADLAGANLTGANLQGTVLRDANLEGVILGGAIYDDVTTQWPRGFDPTQRNSKDRTITKGKG